MTIADAQTTPSEVVVQPAITTTEFMVKEIRESIEQQWVRADIVFGPFTVNTRPDGTTDTNGASRQSLVVWSGADYLAVRDTWTNVDLLAAITALLAN